MTRRANDAYYTPRAAAQELLQELAPLLAETTYGVVVDPACGRGALLDAVALELPKYKWEERIGYEIDPDAAAYTRKHPHGVIGVDYLTTNVGPQVDLFISNPPFSLSHEFVTKMLDERGPYTYVACLLRLGFLGSQKRADWWRAHTPDALRILSKRPSFTDDGRTDNSEYAWYVWIPSSQYRDHDGHDARVAPLGWYGGR